MPAYDRNNVFARILRGDEPGDTQRRVCLGRRLRGVPPELIVGFWRAVGRTASKLGLEGPQAS
jgi:hypothetical protein